MAIDVTCECGKRISVTDESAEQIPQCPDCQQKVRLPSFLTSSTVHPNRERAQSVAAPFKMFDNASSSNHKLSPNGTIESKLALQETSVPLGLSCVYYGFLLLFLVSLLEFAASFMPRRSSPPSESSVTSILGMMGFAAGMLTIVGKTMCLTAPSQMPGRGRIAQAVLLDALAVLLCVFGNVELLPPELIEVALHELIMVRTTAILLLPIWGFASFVMFLRHLGEFLGQREISEMATGFLKLLKLFLIGLLIVVLLTLVQTKLIPVYERGEGLAWLAFVGLLAFASFGSLRYMDLLMACRDALSNCELLEPRS